MPTPPGGASESGDLVELAFPQGGGVQVEASELVQALGHRLVHRHRLAGGRVRSTIARLGRLRWGRDGHGFAGSADQRLHRDDPIGQGDQMGSRRGAALFGSCKATQMPTKATLRWIGKHSILVLWARFIAPSVPDAPGDATSPQPSSLNVAQFVPAGLMVASFRR